MTFKKHFHTITDTHTHTRTEKKRNICKLADGSDAQHHYPQHSLPHTFMRIFSLIERHTHTNPHSHLHAHTQTPQTLKATITRNGTCWCLGESENVLVCLGLQQMTPGPVESNLT